MQVPCGKCPACVNRRASGWSFRLMQEERHCRSAYFVTLTYCNEQVPITENHFLTLKKRHVQLFFKNLRKRHDTRKLSVGKDGRHIWRTVRTKDIKYYAVGEYGGKFKRPHYHAIVFNADVEKIAKAWVDRSGTQRGTIHIGYVTNASVGYCMKYMSKPEKVGKFKRDDRIKEFALMSKGVGLCYLTEAVIKWHRSTTDRMYINLDQGKKAAMPRYYKERIWTKGEREVIGSLTRERKNYKDLEKVRINGPMDPREWEEAIKARFRDKGIKYSLTDVKNDQDYAKIKIPVRRAA